MAFDTTPFVKDFTTVGVLFFVFLLIYSKFKGKTIGEAFRDLKEGIGNMLGGGDEEKVWEKKPF